MTLNFSEIIMIIIIIVVIIIIIILSSSISSSRGFFGNGTCRYSVANKTML